MNCSVSQCLGGYLAARLHETERYKRTKVRMSFVTFVSVVMKARSVGLYGEMKSC